MVLVVFIRKAPRKRTLKKYRSRPKAVAGALLPDHGVWPSMTMMKHIKDARVRHIGVRIHAKRPTLPIFAVAVVVVGLVVGGNRVRLTDVTQETESIVWQ
jgi:hypothetical protein